MSKCIENKRSIGFAELVLSTIKPKNKSLLKNSIKAILILLFCINLSEANAKRYYVNDGSTTGDIFCSAIGNDANSGLTAALPKANLSNAIAAASAGDTIFVDAGTWGRSGTYLGSNIAFNKAITVFGAGTANTIFDNNNGANVFAIISSGNVVIKNLTLTRYFKDLATSGEVINISGAYSGIVLENIVITNCLGATTTLPNINIESGASVVVKNSFLKCSGYNALSGGGIRVSASTLVVDNTLFKENENWANNGGAIQIFGATSNVTVKNSTFASCKSNNAGAIYQGGGTLTVTGSCFDGNRSESDNSTDGGGAVYISGTIVSASFTNCTFTNNQCANNDLNAGSADGCAFKLNGVVGTFNLNSCSFSNNGLLFTFDKGQDIFLSEGGAPGITGSMTNCTFNTPKAGEVNIYNNNMAAGDFPNTFSTPYTIGGTAFTTDGNAPVSLPVTNCTDPASSASCSSSVNCATETIPPVIFDCAPDTVLAGSCNSVLPDFRPLVFAYDDCSFTLAQSPLPGTVITGANVITITATDQAGNTAFCTFNATGASGGISAPSPGTTTQPTCAVATGSIALSGLPATGTWTVTASPGGATITGSGTTATFSGLTAGTYTFTVTNSLGCTSSSSISATINAQPITPAAPLTGSTTEPTCALATGSVDLTGLPATGTWTVTATPGGATLTGSGTTATFSGLTAGTYTFTVTNSLGCTSSSSTSATINAQPITPAAPVTGSTTQPTCAVATGSVDLTGLPATGTWTVTATPGGTTLTGSGTTATFSGLTAGTYTFTVTNSLGCTSSSSISATINAQPITPAAPLTGSTTEPTCALATGSVDLTGLPATGTWTVTASPGGATLTGSGISATFSGLVPGIYTFTVINSLGCTSSSSTSATINTQPNTPSAPLLGTTIQPTCAVATGSVDLSGLPATGTWTVTASPGGATLTGSGISATFSGLVPGIYTFTVTNSLGCTSSFSNSATIVAQPGTPSSPILGIITQPTCAIDTGSVVLSGLPSTGTWIVTATPGGTTITGSGTTGTFSGLAAGTYTFTVTNSLGCTSSSSTSATINAQPTTPTAPVTGSTTQPTCTVATGSIDLTGLPATGTWTVTASPGGATITGSGTTATFSGLTAGTYTFTVTNSLGCTSSSSTSTTINAQPNTPAAPILGSTTQPSCSVATGSIALSGLPATGTWTVTAIPGGATITGSGTSATFSGLAAGTYTYTVTNSLGCTSIATTSVTINAQPNTPAAPILGSTTQPTCTVATGSIALSGLPVTGTWTVTASPGGAIITGSGTTATFSGLTAGTYTFTVTNSLGCTSMATASVIINAQPTIPSAPLLGTTIQPTCTVATGSVTLNGLPASGTWTVTATPGGATITGSGTSATFSGLASGTYSFTVTNSSGCSSLSSTSATINSQPTTPTVSISGNSPICEGQQAIITATGGGIYLWNTMDTTSVIYDNPVITTLYTVTVTNSSGCSATNGFQVTVIATPTVTLTSDPSNYAYPGQLITFTAEPVGYTTYNFYINNSIVQTGPDNVYQTTTFTNGQVVSVSVDNNGCTSDIDSSLTLEIKPIPNAFTPDNDGTNDIFMKGFDLTIYNRWGQEIYSGKDGWDGNYKGNKVFQGTYYYSIKMIDVDGSEKIFKGPVTVVIKK